MANTKSCQEPNELEAWKLMMDSMIKFIHASTKLMNTFNKKASNAILPELCEVECLPCVPDNAAAQKDEPKPKPVVCAAKATLQKAKKDDLVPAEISPTKDVDVNLSKTVKSTEKVNPLGDSKSKSAAELCVCKELKEIKETAAKAGVDVESKEKCKCKGKKSKSKTQLCACPVGSKEKANLTESVVVKLEKAQQEIDGLKQELQKLQFMESSRKSNTAALYKEIMKDAPVELGPCSPPRMLNSESTAISSIHPPSSYVTPVRRQQRSFGLAPANRAFSPMPRFTSPMMQSPYQEASWECAPCRKPPQSLTDRSAQQNFYSLYSTTGNSSRFPQSMRPQSQLGVPQGFPQNRRNEIECPILKSRRQLPPFISNHSQYDQRGVRQMTGRSVNGGRSENSVPYSSIQVMQAEVTVCTPPRNEMYEGPSAYEDNQGFDNPCDDYTCDNDRCENQ